MSGIFFTAPLVKSSSQGSAWAQVDAYFPELQVFANCLLAHTERRTVSASPHSNRGGPRPTS
jgi:hypothetical protein